MILKNKTKGFLNLNLYANVTEACGHVDDIFNLGKIKTF